MADNQTFDFSTISNSFFLFQILFGPAMGIFSQNRVRKSLTLSDIHLFLYTGVLTGTQKEISHHSQGRAAWEGFDRWLFLLFDQIMLWINPRLNCSKRHVLEEMKSDAQIQAPKTEAQSSA